MSKKEVKKVDEFETVENALTTSEAFIEKNQKKILYVLGGIALVVVIVLAVKNFYMKPREVEAANEMSKSQLYFSRDSFQVALNGDGVESIGFLAINEDYGMTSSGNLAATYAGICYYHLGKYDAAIDYLTEYDGTDNYFSVTVIGLIGDCYAEKGEVEKAIKYFEQAADAKNDVLSPFYHKKAGVAFETIKDNESALKHYQAIKNEYPASAEAAEMDKYIARIQD